MATTHVVKLAKGGSVDDCFKGEVLKHFTKKGHDKKGTLVMKDDACVKIEYTVDGDSVTFKCVEAPRLFSAADQKKGMENLFG